MIAEAQNAVANRRGSEQGRVDAMLDGKDVPDQRGLRTPLPGELGGRAAPASAAPSLGKAAASTTVSPGVSAYAPSSSGNPSDGGGESGVAPTWLTPR